MGYRDSNTNTAGMIGFIFACLGAGFFWLPFLGGIFWLIGAVLSCIGLGGRNNGLAWFGFWISFAWIIVYFIFGLMFNTFSYWTLYPLYIW